MASASPQAVVYTLCREPRDVVRISNPIPYQGSKRALAPLILAHFPDCVGTLVEPFAGSAAVSLAASHYGKAKRFFINDINHALIDLWDHIVARPEEIADAYARLWQAQQGRERQFYDTIRAEFNKAQRADYFLYLLARCVKASIRYNPSGHFNQSPDNRRKGARPATMKARILGASALLQGRAELSHVDYREVLKDVTPRDIVYMDPPYRGVCSGKDNRYVSTRSFDATEFLAALHALNNRNISFILSYDGRTGGKTFGQPMPETLGLKRLEINVGRSSQATLLGRSASTVESLYLSPALVARGIRKGL